MKIRVRDGFQINHQGVHVGGDVFDAPEAKAKRWITSGLAIKAESGSKNKAVQSSANKTEEPELSMANTKDELLEAAEDLDVDESNTKAEILEALDGAE